MRRTDKITPVSISLNKSKSENDNPQNASIKKKPR